LKRRRFLQLAVATPFIVEGVATAMATPTPAAVTRAKYADLFVEKLPFLDEILVSSYLTDTTSWFLVGGKEGVSVVKPYDL
jgi:hypothetical protein